MSPTPGASRITVDFRGTVMPSRTWILGVDDGAPDRLELIAFERRDVASGPQFSGPRMTLRPTLPAGALLAECVCPDFCERDHANE